MRYPLLLIILLHVYASVAFAGQFDGQVKIIAGSPHSNQAFGIDVALEGDLLVVGASEDNQLGSGKGAVYVFKRNAGDPRRWDQEKKVLPSDHDGLSRYFGYSIALEDEILYVGAPRYAGATQETGAVYIYGRNQGGYGNWGLIRKIFSDDGVSGDFFGEEIAVHGGTLVVGAQYQESGPAFDEGAAYVYERNQGGTDNWGFVKKLVGSDISVANNFGAGVSIFQDTIAVGTPNAPAVYIYERNSGGTGNWGETKKIEPVDYLFNAGYASNLRLLGDTLLVSQRGNSIGTPPTFYVYQRNLGGDDNWGELKTIGLDGELPNKIGVDADSADRVAVSTNRSVFILERNNGGLDNWGRAGKIRAFDDEAGDSSFAAVSVSGKTIAMGMPLDNVVTSLGNSYFSAGSAYIVEDGIDLSLAIDEGVLNNKRVNESVEYRYVVSNADDLMIATNVRLIHTFPASATVLSATAPDGCFGTLRIECSINQLNTSSFAQITIVASYASAGDKSGLVELKADQLFSLNTLGVYSIITQIRPAPSGQSSKPDSNQSGGGGGAAAILDLLLIVFLSMRRLIRSAPPHCANPDNSRAAGILKTTGKNSSPYKHLYFA